MHFSLFLAPSILLTGHIIIVSASVTPDFLLILLRDAVEDINQYNNDALTITALNAETQYPYIMENTIDFGNELTEDGIGTQGSANLNKTAENDVSEVFDQLTTDILTYFTTLQNAAPDFLDPSQKKGMVAAIAALENGYTAFLFTIADIVRNVTLNANIIQQIDIVQRAYAFATAAYGDAE